MVFKNVFNGIQGVQFIVLTMGISETVRDTNLIKLDELMYYPGSNYMP